MGLSERSAGARRIVNDSGSRPTRVTEQEDATVQLLRVDGPRTPVAPERIARVRAAVGDSWQREMRRRAIRRRVATTGMLAGAAGLGLFLIARSGVFERALRPIGEPVAVVEAVNGAATGVRQAETIRVGQWIETGPATRLRLRFGDGTSVRLDHDSRLRARSAEVIELSSGGVYIDRGQESGSLEIRTPFGTARDIGTQFEVRLLGAALRLRVRTGMVELRDSTRAITARPGTEIMLAAEGAVTRPIPAHSAEWAWASSLSPPLEMDGKALGAFLDGLAREQGWTVEYADAPLAREAETIILHGSVAGLVPVDAVAVAIASSGLQHRLAEGSLLVRRAEP
jgi:ferric-dicitrate binding protein FerR (iron transport regulator)